MAQLQLDLDKQLDIEFIEDCESWLHDQFEKLTDELIIMHPSEWAEIKRYLPPRVTPMPGYYSYDVAPYWREVVDCLSPFSPIREVSVMKGVQVGFTVGVLENWIGYLIDYVRNSPVGFITADAELAQLRMESYIIPMINESGLDHLIKSSDEKNTRKTGKTTKKLEWQGGFLVPLGAQNPNKLRSLSLESLAEDEVDGWPNIVGKGSDPMKDVEDRTAAYLLSRKILRGSTPLVSQTSKILPEYKKSDQRKYMVPCKHCNEKQELVFTGTNADGTLYGIDYSRDEDGILIEDSVVYICKYCQGEMINDDKAWMYREGGKHCEWTPTSKSENPNTRSYHISALYSPVGMETWTNLVRKWFECWDVEANRVKDIDKLQWFYNNVLGLPFEQRGEALKFERVVLHRRTVYNSGEIPNTIAFKETGSKIQLLTCAVDVHKHHLDVQVIGWCGRGRFYSIEWLKLEGDCEDLDSEPWNKVRELVQKTYQADDGRLYEIQLTLIDSQYNSSTVHEFCNEYSQGVYPIAGRALSVKGAKLKEFSETTSALGQPMYLITTTLYKDRLSAALRREWDPDIGHLQPDWHPNFPQDYPDVFFKELTVEVKKEVIDPRTKQRKGFVWHGRNAHAWDLTVYCSAAVDILAFGVCQTNLNIEYLDRVAFYELCEKEGLFWREA